MTSEPIYVTNDLRIYPAESVFHAVSQTSYRIRQIDQRVGGRWVPSFDVKAIGG